MRPKKIKLNKVTVASLNNDEMYNIRGATIYHGCDLDTKSCTVFMECCPSRELLENNLKED